MTKTVIVAAVMAASYFLMAQGAFSSSVKTVGTSASRTAAIEMSIDSVK